MIKLYLVTGFLGAGKTTFLKNFVSLFSKQRLALVINEFGKEGIDGKLLSPLGINMSEINNGSIFCSCRQDQFEHALTELIERKPEVIIVEASGLSDPTNIHELLSSRRFVDNIKYIGSICMVDALNFKKVYSTARVCKRQIAVSEVAIINKIDLVGHEDVEDVKSMLLNQKPSLKILQTTFGNIEPSWIENMTTLASNPISDSMQIQDITLQKHLIYIRNSFTYSKLIKFIEMFVEDTYRVKGFVSLGDEIYFVDCVYTSIKVVKHDSPIDPDVLGKLIVLSGKGMPTRRSILEAVKWYKDDSTYSPSSGI